MVTIKPGTPIRRKDTIPNDERTDKRDATADVIDELWPAEKKKIAETADCSRTHVDNVLERYFEPVDPNSSPNIISSVKEADTDLQVMAAYMEGWLDCYHKQGGESINTNGLQAVLQSATE